MSKCHRIRHLIGPYLYDDVSTEERAAVESHLQQCAACRAEVEALRGLISAIPGDTMRADATAKARALYAVQSRIAEQHSRRPGWRRWRETVFATALVAGAALVFNLWTTYRPPQLVSPAAPTVSSGTKPKPGATEISASTLWTPGRSSRVTSSSTHHGGRGANRRRGRIATPAEVADSGRHDETVVLPASPQDEQVAPPGPQQTPGNHSSLKRQLAPPAVVEVAVVVPVAVTAPPVTGVDDVTQAPIAPEQE